jgi:hypothetical protein
MITYCIIDLEEDYFALYLHCAPLKIQTASGEVHEW